MQENVLKLTRAVYRFLDYLPDGDPLKNKAKEKALHILEGAATVFEGHGWLSLKDYWSAERREKAAHMVKDIHVLQGYLEIAKSQGWVNPMNMVIIKKEYEILENALRSQAMVAPALIAPKTMVPAKGKIAPKAVESIRQEEVSQKGRARQARILELIRHKGIVQVADIIKEIPSITKRTVRRDFEDLMKQGTVERVGSWNKASYKLKNQ